MKSLLCDEIPVIMCCLFDFWDMAWSVSDYWLCHVIEGWCQNVVFLDPESIGSLI